MTNNGHLATLLFDLLTPKEAFADAADGHLRFDIPLLASRLESALDWASVQPATQGLRLGVFGAASERPDGVSAVVSRGGRPDLAGMASTEDAAFARTCDPIGKWLRSKT